MIQHLKDAMNKMLTVVSPLNFLAILMKALDAVSRKF